VAEDVSDKNLSEHVVDVALRWYDQLTQERTFLTAVTEARLYASLLEAVHTLRRYRS